MVEYVYNNAKYESTGIILFEAKYGLNPSIYRLRRKDKADNKYALITKT